MCTCTGLLANPADPVTPDSHASLQLKPLAMLRADLTVNIVSGYLQLPSTHANVRAAGILSRGLRPQPRHNQVSRKWQQIERWSAPPAMLLRQTGARQATAP
jgi:hypothetical protein